MVYPVLVGGNEYATLYYAGEDDRFGPFFLTDSTVIAPHTTGLTRSDAIDWMVRFSAWGRADARQQVDEAVQWFSEAQEREL